MNADPSFSPEAYGPTGGSKEAFLSEYNLNDRGQQRDDDKGVHAEFSLYAVLMGFKSKEAGKEIFEDREFVTIRIRGQDKTEVVREATELDKRRFPRQYAEFKAGNRQARMGTSILQLVGMTPARAMTFQQFNIHTIEDLAEVADGYLQNLGMGARDLRRQAQEFVSNGKTANSELQAKLDTQQQQIAQLMELTQKLSDQNAQLLAKADKKGAKDAASI